MDQKSDFGVLYGQKTQDDVLLIYSAYEDAKASPSVGDFIVLTPKDESNPKFLARIEQEVYDEDPMFRNQDKTLVAVHYARIAERDLSERDKQKMFSYTYRVRMLGTFDDKGTSLAFTTAVRKLPVVSYHARHLNPKEIEHILNYGNQNGVGVGHFCVGEVLFKNKGEIRFDLNRLRRSRTLVLAQSGFGKTNFVKVLAYHLCRDNSYGKLIFDLNGEYATKSQDTCGLGDIDEPKIRENLVVFTDRQLPPEYKDRFTHGGSVTLNTHKHMTVGDILNFAPGFSEVMKSLLLYLDDEGVEDFVQNINSYVTDPAQLHKKYPDFWATNAKDPAKDTKEEVSSRKTIAGIRKRIGHLIESGKGIHSSSSTLVEQTMVALKQGKTVVIDLSLKDSTDASIISTILVRKLFEDNKRNYTGNAQDKVIEAVTFIEEAQNVLSEEFVRSNANPFVRLAKEGRKFGLGLVAVTQRPSAIAEEIRSQADNFFAFHLGNTDDIKSLVRSNINYDGVISSFLQRETIKGNLYMVTASQSFVVPVRVFEFEKMVASKLYPASSD